MGKRNPEKLSAIWSKRFRDVFYRSPNQWDGHLLHAVLCAPRWNVDGERQKTFIEELEARGYDITTLRFEVLRKKKGDPDEG